MQFEYSSAPHNFFKAEFTADSRQLRDTFSFRDIHSLCFGDIHLSFDNSGDIHLSFDNTGDIRTPDNLKIFTLLDILEIYTLLENSGAIRTPFKTSRCSLSYDNLIDADKVL